MTVWMHTMYMYTLCVFLLFMHMTVWMHTMYVHVCLFTSYKDSIVAILRIQNSIILIQTTEYNNFM